MQSLHPLVIAFYLALPLAAAGVAFLAARRRRSRRPWVDFFGTCISAIALSIALNIAFAVIAHSRVQFGQILLTCYLAVSVLMLLKAISRLLKTALEWLFGVNVMPRAQAGWPVSPAASPAAAPASTPAQEILAESSTELPATTAQPSPDVSPSSPSPSDRPTSTDEAEQSPADLGWNWAVRVAAALMLRVLILFGIGVPYIVAIGLVYRPKLSDATTPRQILNADYQTVSFESADGVQLAGWWIPAPPAPADADPSRNWGRKTVILCPEVWTSKSSQLSLVEELFHDGYNILAFDFRGQGDSGGQLVTFGDKERADVLAAIHWARQAHARECQRLFGVGAGTGAAALIAAAADESPDARALDAIAAYDTFDRFDSLPEYLLRDQPGLNWLADHFAIPLMSVHAGADLKSFAPADLVDRIAPRPLLVIHGRGDNVVSFDAGMRLYQRASMPKLRCWIGKFDKKANEGNGGFLTRGKKPADHEGTIHDPDAAHAVHLMFEEMPKVM